MTRFLSMFTFLFTVTSVFAQPQLMQKQSFSIGESAIFHSEILNENRTINIYLPLEYHADSAKVYPVIYLLDGSADEDFVHIAGLVQFCTFPWVKMLPESILIGISNVDRKRDFTYPTTVDADKKDFPTTGGSAAFIRFLGEELQPFVVKNYHTKAGERTIIGQSLGGLLAAEILMKQPDLFDNYILVSPSIWWDNESLLTWEPAPFKTPQKVYLAVGKQEHPVMVKTTQDFRQKLDALHNRSIFYHEWDDQDHGNILHLALYEAFERIFGNE